MNFEKVNIVGSMGKASRWYYSNLVEEANYLDGEYVSYQT